MKSVGLTVIIALSLAGGASAEVVARGVHDGMVAVAPGGTPLVAYMRGTSLDRATRAGGRWHTARVCRVAPGSTLVAFAAGAAGAFALVRDTDERTLLLLQRRAGAWRGTQLVGRLPVGTTIGWPGLTLDRRGLPVVAYTRWRRSTHRSALILARVDSGRVRTERITAEGFPKSHVAPPAAPVVVRGRVHVIETYGFDGAVGTIDWTRQKRTWEGQFIDAGIGDFPVGPMFAATGRHGTVYAAWSQVLFAISGMPVSAGRPSSTVGSPTSRQARPEAATSSSPVPAPAASRGSARRGRRVFASASPPRWAVAGPSSSAAVCVEPRAAARLRSTASAWARLARRWAPSRSPRTARTRSSTTRLSGRFSTAPSTPRPPRGSRTQPCCAIQCAKSSFQNEALCHRNALCGAWTASSVAPVSPGYERSLRPCHAPPSAPRRRSVILKGALRL